MCLSHEILCSSECVNVYLKALEGKGYFVVEKYISVNNKIKLVMFVINATLIIYLFDIFYIRALKDAEKSVALCPSWPKGYYRKGRALLGLKVSLLFMTFLKLAINMIKISCWHLQNCICFSFFKCGF